jgi:hypothetical protein
MFKFFLKLQNYQIKNKSAAFDCTPVTNNKPKNLNDEKLLPKLKFYLKNKFN